MNNNVAMVATYNSRNEAEAGINDLQRFGFDRKKLSVVGKDYRGEESVIGFYKAGDRLKMWGKLGAFWRLFSNVGIPESSIEQYEAAIIADKFLVLAQGTAAEVASVKSILAINADARIADYQQLLAA